MKKQGFFERKRCENEKKYIEKHGRNKFLIEQTKAYDVAVFMVICCSLTIPTSLYMGFWLKGIVFAAGVIFHILGALMLLATIMLAVQLPRMKRKSKEAEEYLLKILETAEKKD